MDNNIAEGAVFHLKGIGIENHFHIIANIDAATGSALLLGVITSHVEMRKQDAEDTDEKPETIVDISPEQCPCLSHDSVIDCNDPLVIKRVNLEKIIATGDATFKCNISHEITSKIRHGIGLSRSANRDAKGLLTY